VPTPIAVVDVHGLSIPMVGGGCPEAPPLAPLSVSIEPAEEASPAGRTPLTMTPAAAASPCAADFPEFGVGITAGLANVEHVSLPSGSSDQGTVFAPGVTPVAYGPVPLTASRSRPDGR